MPRLEQQKPGPFLHVQLRLASIGVNGPDGAEGTFSSLAVWYPEVMVKKRRSNIANRLLCLAPFRCLRTHSVSRPNSLPAAVFRLVSSRLASSVSSLLVPVSVSRPSFRHTLIL